MLIKKGLGTVQEAIDDTNLNDKECAIRCNQCNNTMTRTNEYGPHIFLDTSLETDPHYKSEIHIESTLESITKSIYLDDRHYTLCGIINYIFHNKSNSENLRQGHYVAIAFTGMH